MFVIVLGTVEALNKMAILNHCPTKWKKKQKTSMLDMGQGWVSPVPNSETSADYCCEVTVF